MSVKLTELREPRLEAREPRLLPEETVRVLADRLKREEQPGARGWSLLVPTASRASGLLHEEQNCLGPVHPALLQHLRAF